MLTLYKSTNVNPDCLQMYPYCSASQTTAPPHSRVSDKTETPTSNDKQQHTFFSHSQPNWKVFKRSVVILRSAEKDAQERLANYKVNTSITQSLFTWTRQSFHDLGFKIKLCMHQCTMTLVCLFLHSSCWLSFAHTLYIPSEIQIHPTEALIFKRVT